MKQVMLFLMAAMLFAACNQNTADKKEKGGGGLFGGGGNDDGGGGREDDNGGGGKKKGRWSSQDRNQFLKDCNASMPGTQANQVCDCVLSKIEAEYASLADADRMGGEAAGARISQQCVQEITGGGYDDGGYDDGGNDDGGYDDGGNNNRGGGNSWTTQQKKQFIQGCVVDAKRNGLNTQQANTYCECMTNKVAQQYTFAQAGKMSPADLQTPEWQQAAQACLQGGGGQYDDY